jgi:hypothetical protein
VDIVAVDWSGARDGAARHIWAAQVRAGSLTDLRCGRTRDEVIDDLVSLRDASVNGLTVGLDFSFSLPAWFLRQQGHASVGDLWAQMAREGEGWLVACETPFWGRPGRGRPDLPAHLRQAESRARVNGIGAKSTFQIGGAGAVGTGSLRGMPHLMTLRRAGFTIWPFDPPSPWTVVEIYPRLLTGPVHKRNREARVRYLDHASWDIPAPFRDCMDKSEDAFDTGIAALVMDAHAPELRALVPATDPVTLLEGDIWSPRTIAA